LQAQVPAEAASEPATLPDNSPRHFPWSGSEYLPTSEVLDIGRFCGVDRLQITCHRRSENPSAVTAKTPKNGLEITAGTCALAAYQA
jgi:hypothetical protein